MYHPLTIRARVAQAEKAYKREFVEHSIAEVKSWVARLSTVYDEHGRPTRSVTAEEARFIENEQVMTKFNYLYWASRYCNPPEAPIWMGDLSFRPIGDVHVGDHVVGWAKRAGKKSHGWVQDMLTTCEVTAISRRKAPIVRVVMESGREIRCTPDHLWRNGCGPARVGTWQTSGGEKRLYRYEWIQAKPGKDLAFVIDPPPVVPPGMEYAAGWLGGIYDGEGSHTFIAQYKSANPLVYAKIAEALSLFGLYFTPSATGFNLIGGRQALLNFLHIARPIKSTVLKSRIFGGRFGHKDRVVSVTPDGEGEVVGLQTTTGNYVVWGYASKNCMVNKQGDRDAVDIVAPMFPFLETQEFIHSKVAEAECEQFTDPNARGIRVNILKAARQIGACLIPTTKVLTADLRWIDLGSVTVGDELLGVDEETPGGKGRSRKMRRTVVEAKVEHIQQTFRITLDNGETLIATEDHRFLSHMRGGTTTCWHSVKKLAVGHQLRYAIKPWTSGDPDEQWYGGLLDGEGSFRKRKSIRKGRPVIGGCELTMTQCPGAVLDRARAYYERAGIVFYEAIDAREPGDSSKLGKKPVHKLCVNRLEDALRVVGTSRPTRWTNGTWWEGCEPPGCVRGQGWATIISIEPAGVQRVIDLQTSTKTYIAEGFISHNSTYAESIATHRITTQNGIFGLIASDVPETSAYLFDMLERMIFNLPWWLRPQIVEHVKNTELVTDGGSNIWVGSGKSTRGTTGARGQLGRGKALSVIHLSELAQWETAEQLEGSLMPTIPPHPRVIVIFETTAKGQGNWWQKHWTKSRKGLSDFIPIFIPWYIEKKRYSRVPPDDWAPLPTTLAHARRCEETSNTWVGQKVTLSRDQLYWYETKRAEFESDGNMRTFLEDYGAIDDIECFQAAGRSVFGPDLLQKIRDVQRPLVGAAEIMPKRELRQ